MLSCKFFPFFSFATCHYVRRYLVCASEDITNIKKDGRYCIIMLLVSLGLNYKMRGLRFPER